MSLIDRLIDRIVSAPEYPYYVLECDACTAVLGMNSDPAHPSKGITICTECFNNPHQLPPHIKDSIPERQLR